MALYLSIGNKLITPQEVSEKFLNKTLHGKADGSVSKGGSLPTSGELTAFSPVGLGKPLTIEIREIFTGNLPRKAWYNFKSAKDMILTTAWKSITTQAAASRAVNLIKKNVKPGFEIGDFPATEPGTPLISYSPAIVEGALNLTVEFGFKNFSTRIFEKLSAAFRAASSIPVFATQSLYLLAGSQITSMTGRLGKFIFEEGPEFSSTISLNFERAGEESLVAGYGVLFDDSVPKEEAEKFVVNSSAKLVYRDTQQAFDLNYPYVILSFDGKANDAYESFQATAISAELLAGFYNTGKDKLQPMDELITGLKYYSDMKYFIKARKIKEILDAENDTDKKEELKKEYDALMANVLSEDLKALRY